MKYKIEFSIECAVATPKQLRNFFKNLNIDIDNDVVTFPNRIKIKEIKENNKAIKSSKI